MSNAIAIASPRKKSKKVPLRQRLLEIASDLFYRKSIRAVGVEEIVKEAGIAKISLYRNFTSKDELVVAYLENQNTAYWKEIDEVLSAHPHDPRKQLKDLMTYVAERSSVPGYRGCPFINYCGEFAEHDHPGHRVAEANKREWRDRLLKLSKAIGAPSPKTLADGWFLLVEGAYAISQTLGGKQSPAKVLVETVEMLTDAHLKAHSISQKAR
jgi:AcrR family transcriptional regulator